MASAHFAVAAAKTGPTNAVTSVRTAPSRGTPGARSFLPRISLKSRSRYFIISPPWDRVLKGGDAARR